MYKTRCKRNQKVSIYAFLGAPRTHIYSILNAGFLRFTMWANLMSFYKITTTELELILMNA
jgi:hypothetical protein